MAQRPWLQPSPAATLAYLQSLPAHTKDPDGEDPMFWPTERLAARRNELFRRQVGWLAEGSPFYQKMFAAQGIDPGDVTGTHDLVGFPVTTKADLMNDPASFRLKFEHPSLYDRTYVTYFTTGTTTGQPTPYEYTSHDFLGALLAGRRSHRVQGFVPGDVVLTGFPLSPVPHISQINGMMSSAGDVAFLHGLAGPTYPEFPINRPSRALAEMIERVQPTAVSGIGSFLRRMFLEAAGAGRDFSSLKIVMPAGEVLTTRMREHLRGSLERCGASQVHVGNSYSFTEGGIPYTSCVAGSSLHNCAPDQVLIEVVDRETHEPLPDGEPGLVLVTHLNRRGMPLLRYAVGDLSALTHETCPSCGRGGESLLISSGSAHVSRTSELLKIKGTLVNPQVVHDAVMNVAGVLEYQLEVANGVTGDPLSADELRLRVALDTTVQADFDRAELVAAVQNAIEMRPIVTLVDDPAQIYDHAVEFKARRFLDTRAPVE